MNVPKFQFKDNHADEGEGLNDAGIETFRNSPYASCGKEAGQNSKDKMMRRPVKMIFRLLEIEKSDLPFHQELSDTISDCLEQVEITEDPKELDFFVKADDVLKAKTVNVLEISDYNTTGLEGPVEKGSPFHALVKSKGKSGENSSIDSAGSFGIGKNATFAVSDLRTVIYSTVYKDKTNGTEQFLAQGKSKLISHTTPDGEEKLGEGYWGMDDFKEISDSALVPEWMRRNEIGTSLFAIGFPVEEAWEHRIAAGLLRTFFIAISKGEMEINVGEDLRLDAKTMKLYFQNEQIIKAATASHSTDEFEFARQLYECEIDPETTEEIVNIAAIGNTKFGSLSIKILQKEGFPKRIGIIRNGILITDNLKHFDDHFKNFPMCSNFIALIKPLDESGSAVFKLIENPAHDELSAGRISNDTKRDEITKTMKVIAGAIREEINEKTRYQPDHVESIDELSEFFPDENSSKKKEPGESDPQTYTYTSKLLKPAPRKRLGTKGKGQTGGSGTGKGKGKGGGTGGKNPGAGKGTHGPEKIFDLKDERNIAIGSDTRRLHFTPEESGTAKIVIFATGLQDREILEITNVDGEDITEGKWVVDLEKDTRNTAEIKFSTTYNGPIEVEAIEQ